MTAPVNLNSKCFHGKLFSMTGGLERAKLNKIIKINGGEQSTVVCRRTNYVICTQDAVDKNTQRVRKARTKRLPLVSADWLVACHEAKQLLDHEPYIIRKSDATTAGAAGKSRSSSTAAAAAP
jgi:BRCT domain type II-containing protein